MFGALPATAMRPVFILGLAACGSIFAFHFFCPCREPLGKPSNNAQCPYQVYVFCSRIDLCGQLAPIGISRCIELDIFASIFKRIAFQNIVTGFLPFFHNPIHEFLFLMPSGILKSAGQPFQGRINIKLKRSGVERTTELLL